MLTLRFQTSQFPLRTLVHLRQYVANSSVTKRRTQNIISTLKPTLLSPGDFVRLSGRFGITIRFPISVGNGSRVQYLQQEDLKAPRIAFPRGSQGFFYYHSDPHGALLEGSLRFRVTSDSNAASSFSRGSDLVFPSGYPWKINLPQLACHKTYSLIRQQLLAERLVSDNELHACENIYRLGRRRSNPPITLFRIGSPFLVDFSRQLTLVAVVDSQQTIRFNQIFTDQANGVQSHQWTGMAIARFEPSTRREDAGRRIIHLRILKITHPVSCTAENYTGRIIAPQEGELFSSLSRRGVPEPWAYDIDHDTRPAIGLRALWENSTASQRQ
ncbi:hypothetical protein C8R43DRAFT_607942 [Mycena crocata]|nr:hypothetical protein C8R43DRAFT_607942 [Mycena crocata]